MENSPCKGCIKTAECGDEMCVSWRLWFGHQWDVARYNLGAKPPKRRGPAPNYVYEVRSDGDGTVLFRGSMRDCAGLLGRDESSIRSAVTRGTLFADEIRITRIEVAPEEPQEEQEVEA